MTPGSNKINGVGIGVGFSFGIDIGTGVGIGINISILESMFLATLVALHFTPVSEWVIVSN